MSSSTLDMALDDMIKKGGGNKRGGRADKKGNTIAGRKIIPVKSKMAEKKADPPKPKEGPGPSREGLLGRLKFAKGVAIAAISMANKAAAAAAKATATGTTPSQQGRTAMAAVAAKALGSITPRVSRPAGGGGRVERTAKKAPAAAAAAQPKGSVESTAAKLSMTLEDICKTEVRGGKGNKTEKKAEGKFGAKADEGKLGRRGGRRMRLKLNRDGTNLKKKVEPKANGKANGKAKAKGKARAKGDAKNEKGAKGGKAAGKGAGSWDQWGGKGGGAKGGGAKGGGKGSWGGDGWAASNKRTGKGDDWGLPAKRMRGDSWEAPPARAGDFGWGRGSRDDAYSAKGGGGRWPSDMGKGGRDDGRWGAPDAWSSGARASERERAPPPSWDRGDRFPASRRDEETWIKPTERAPPARTDTSGTRIKVTNVPLDLDRRDIKEAFEDRGRVIRCEVDRGVAFVTFERAIDAKKAIQTFDRGELNGQTIFVSQES